MAKYKLLNQEGYATFNFAAGDVYDETDENSAGLTVLYAGLAEINWPLIPATILGFYLLIKNERNGRKKIL